MTWIRTVTVSFLAVLALCAQPAAPPAISGQPDSQALAAAARAARRNTTVADEVKAEVDRLLAQAATLQSAGQSGEARRAAAHACVLLGGKTWDATQEFAWSLVLRADRIVADPSVPFLARLSQLYAAPRQPVAALRMRAWLAQGDKVREIAGAAVTSRDLIEQPFGLDADLGDAADGAWVLRVEIQDGEASIATLEQPIQLARGIDSARPDVERRLARIQGHEGAKATVRYPFQLARAVNARRRQFNQADFGIPWDAKQPPYDFAAGLRASLELLKSLESGKDPLWRAKGDHERHYWLEDAGEPMAYRVYVPLKWDGRARLPMVLVLHGATRDQDYYFDRDGGILAKLAEQHGYLVAAPMGYRPSVGWGSMLLRGSGRGGVASDSARIRQSELSEKDALNVLDLVSREYDVDPARIYLFGHSAGGAGTWYLGQKYRERWAAIAASAAPTRPEGFPFARLKSLPVMVCHGDNDDEVPVANSRNMVRAMRESGGEPVYLEVPGATHLTIVALVEPKVFEFFDRHAHR